MPHRVPLSSDVVDAVEHLARCARAAEDRFAGDGEQADLSAARLAVHVAIAREKDAAIAEHLGHYSMHGYACPCGKSWIALRLRTKDMIAVLDYAAQLECQHCGKKYRWQPERR